MPHWTGWCIWVAVRGPIVSLPQYLSFALFGMLETVVTAVVPGPLHMKTCTRADFGQFTGWARMEGLLFERDEGMSEVP
jgi:hypothetical protein